MLESANDWLSQEEVDALLKGVPLDDSPPPMFSFIHKITMYGRNINVIECCDEVVDYVKWNYKEHEDWAYGYGKRNLYVSDDLFLMITMKFK